MNKITKMENFIKKNLKKKVRITLGMMVTLLITGIPTFAESTESTVEYVVSLSSNLTKLNNKDVKLFDFSKSVDKPEIPLTPIIPSTPVEPEIPLTPIVPSTPVEPEIPLTPIVPSTPVFKGSVIEVNGKQIVDIKDYETKEDTIGQNLGDISYIYKVGSTKEGITGTLTNKHTISSSIDSSVGIYTENKGTGINNGNIEVNDLSTGMMAHNNGIITNNNKIEAGIGMSLYSGATGENNGTIDSSIFGVSVNGIGTTFSNSKIGIINGDIEVNEQGLFTNNGLIKSENINVYRKGQFLNNNLISSDSNLSINTTSTDDDNRFADGKFINEKTGTIKVNGTLTVGRTEHEGGTINRGNIIAQKINGNIIDEGGTINAETLSGNLVLTGDSIKNYDKYFISNDINIENLDGKVVSNSVLYDVDTREDGKIALERKDFSEVISDKTVASYFENNFTMGTFDKQFLLDNLKNISEISELNNAGNSSLGTNFYPNMKKQTKEIIDFNNKTLDRYFVAQSNKDIRIIAGANYKDSSVDSSNLIGYDEYLSNVFVGADKRFGNNRLGASITVGKLDSSYDNNSDRKDTFYQTSLYNVYSNNDIILKNNIYFGLSDGDIERTLSFKNINEKMSGDIKSKYIGINNYIGKTYSVKDFYITPSFVANFTYLNQDKIEETGRYALTIDENNSYSIESGIGLEIGKKFIINDINFAIGTFGNIYHEFANPYKELDSKFNVMSNEKYEIAKYERENYGDLGIKLELEKENINLYTELKYIFDSKTNYEAIIGASYKF